MKEAVRTTFEGIALLLFGIALFSIVSMCRTQSEREVFRGSFPDDPAMEIEEAELLMLQWEVEKQLNELNRNGE